MKTCSTCGAVKPVSEFHRKTKAPDGLAYSCKSCAIERARAHRRNGPKVWPEVAPEKACNTCNVVKPLEDYFPRLDTRDKRDGRCKACVAEAVRIGRANRPEMYARQKKDSAKQQAARNRLNPEEKRARERAQYAKTREHRQAKLREQYRKNADAYKLRARARKIRLRGAWTPEGDEWAKVLANDPCAYCGEPATGVDHIDPIISGGLHIPDNLTACCRSCNSSKRATPLLQFLLRRAS